MHVPLLTGSMGRLFAAGMNSEELRARFQAIGWQRPLEFETYQDQVAEAAERGWAVDAGYLSPNTWGASAPVPHPGRPLDRVVSVMLLTGEPDPRTVEPIMRDLVAASRSGTPPAHSFPMSVHSPSTMQIREPPA